MLLCSVCTNFAVENVIDMFDIAFDDVYRELVHRLRVVAVTATVVNAATSDALWAELESVSAKMKEAVGEMAEINRRSSIAATRAAYKALGKDPNRYRPSAEALCRRVMKGMPLYRTLSVVDIINVVSIASGYSIGGFDADKIVGNVLRLGVGRVGEPYEAIGRGELNIAGLPVYRDAVGGIGTPTSDHERTKLSADTTHVLVIINAYDGDIAGAHRAADMLAELLTRYAAASNIEIIDFQP